MSYFKHEREYNTYNAKKVEFFHYFRTLTIRQEGQ